MILIKYFRWANTLKSQLVSPKDKDSKSKKTNCIYGISCCEPSCSAKYIGESCRTLEERLNTQNPTSSGWLQSLLLLSRFRTIKKCDEIKYVYLIPSSNDT